MGLAGVLEERSCDSALLKVNGLEFVIYHFIYKCY